MKRLGIGTVIAVLGGIGVASQQPSDAAPVENDPSEVGPRRYDEPLDIEWEKRYQTVGQDGATSVVHIERGYLVGGSKTATEAAEPDAWIGLLNRDGKTVDSRTFTPLGNDNRNTVTDIQEAHSGFFLLGNGWVMKISDSLNKEWDYFWDNVNSIANANDGGILLAGTDDGTTRVVKLTGNGEEDWIREFEGAGAESIIQAHDSGHILLARSKDKIDIRLTKIGAAGEVNWNTIYEPRYARIEPIALAKGHDNGYIFTGSDYVSDVRISVSANGEKRWRYEDGTQRAEAILRLPTGYLFAGLTELPDRGFVDIITNSGHRVWYKEYGTTTTEFFDIESVEDSKFLSVGSLWDPPGREDKWVVKLR